MRKARFGKGNPSKAYENRDKPISKVAYERLQKLNPKVAATKPGPSPGKLYSTGVAIKIRKEAEDLPEGNVRRNRR